jgi:hypothetical protein
MVLAALGRQDRDRRSRTGTGLQLLENLKAVHPGDPKIEQDPVQSLMRCDGEGRIPVRRFKCAMAHVREGLGQSFAQRGVIIDNQDGRRGNSTMKVVPSER